MYLKKRKFIIIRWALAAIFLAVILQPCVFVLRSAFKSYKASANNDVVADEAQANEDVIEVVGKSSCSLENGSCCCGPDAHKGNDCCCKAKAFGRGKIDLAAANSNIDLFDAIITAINCSNNSGDFQIASLSDCEPQFRNSFSLLFEETTPFLNLQKEFLKEPHLSRLFRPPNHLS